VVTPVDGDTDLDTDTKTRRRKKTKRKRKRKKKKSDAPAARPYDGPQNPDNQKIAKETKLGKEIYKHDREDDLRKLFNRLDRNRDGKLNAKELRPIAKTMGLGGKALLLAMDKDNNKSVDFPEFRRYLRKK